MANDALLTQLQATWHRTIPVSQFMQITPEAYRDGTFSVSAPLAPNLNLHDTMFAGSIYTLMTLTGWGAVWLNQRLSEVEGDIVLAKADIRYLAPVDANPVAKVSWPEVDLTVLAEGQKAKVNLSVELYSGDRCCAKFEGTYVSLPQIR
ncbi:thioesterase domain-containing protein [Shewanella colwelliana]|uniref:Thioesterase n=1 Tax=Shewanella colwelliana TaxID=23 RepID=A0A1E5IT93_SHECO|nr:thioesterase domain-containing protein [Shewanella colwelliana]MCZ4337949.1 thioesterase domain-containing protein [Shewanella colwelliana]MDX1281088.1 thioesterase domain-containing protein [Shewanella colwelliana]OEG73801.1 thioesterase [Shewanella colwelliana]